MHGHDGKQLGKKIDDLLGSMSSGGEPPRRPPQGHPLGSFFQPPPAQPPPAPRPPRCSESFCAGLAPRPRQSLHGTFKQPPPACPPCTFAPPPRIEQIGKRIDDLLDQISGGGETEVEAAHSPGIFAPPRRPPQPPQYNPLGSVAKPPPARPPATFTHVQSVDVAVLSPQYLATAVLFKDKVSKNEGQGMSKAKRQTLT